MGWWYTDKSFVFMAKREEKKKHTLDNPYTYQCYLVKLTQRQLSQLSNYVLYAVGIVTHTQALQLLDFLVVVCNPVCSTRPARCLRAWCIRYTRAPFANLGAWKQAKEIVRRNFSPLVFGRQKSC